MGSCLRGFDRLPAVSAYRRFPSPGFAPLPGHRSAQACGKMVRPSPLRMRYENGFDL